MSPKARIYFRVFIIMKLKTLFPITVAAAIPFAFMVSFAKDLPVTAEEQKKLTPDSVLTDLMEGNARFVSGTLTEPNIKESVAAATAGQFPKAFILSCIDSRVPVESVFDQGLGDIFVGRVAGNIENTDQLGSMEFASKVAGVKLIMVLGHEACGAVKGACDGVELGNITSLLANVKPAVTKVAGALKKGEANSKNKAFVDGVIEENVRQTIKDIRERSPLLAEMEKSGEIKIVGGVYSLETGKVSKVD